MTELLTNRHTKKYPEDKIEVDEETIIVTGSRQSTLCIDCFTEHAGPWL